ncbi:hypothetical protein ZWY2020_001255 [Hordeum vulgare]|nr:hypothetical protein ZWY2020_001255 [Hordeum vulgare]
MFDPVPLPRRPPPLLRRAAIGPKPRCPPVPLRPRELRPIPYCCPATACPLRLPACDGAARRQCSPVPSGLRRLLAALRTSYLSADAERHARREGRVDDSGLAQLPVHSTRAGVVGLLLSSGQGELTW